MIIELSVVLTIFSVFAFLYAFDRLTSISVWAGGMMTVCCISYMFNMDFIGGDISCYTFFLVSLSVIAFFIGEFCVVNGINKSQLCLSISYGTNTSKRPSKAFTLLCTCFALVVAWLCIQEMINFLELTGQSNIELFSIAIMIRSAFTSNEYIRSLPLQIGTAISQGIGYVFMYYYMYNTIIHKRTYFYLLLPVFAYICVLMTGTGRTGLMSLVLCVLAQQYIFKKNGFSRFSVVDFIKKASFYIFFLVFIFYTYGNFLRGSDHTLANYFVSYFSISVYGLDHVLEFPWEYNRQFGEYIFSNYYYYINKIFDTNYFIPEHHLPFFSWKNGQSNIFTAILLPFLDFGIVGLVIMNIIIGAVYTYIEIAVLQKGMFNNVLVVSIFSYMFYFNFFYPIANRYMDIFTVTSFPLFILMILFINYLYKRSSEFIF